MAASYEEVRAYLSTIPAASPSWLDALVPAGLSMENIAQLVDTMKVDAESPLRLAESGVLSLEIMRMNQSRGAVNAEDGNGKVVVKLVAVLSPPEQTRVARLVTSFCQPSFKQGGRFGRNGHVVMNTVRRATSGYMFTKIPVGSKVLEVGPDVSNWVTSSQYDKWTGSVASNYKGSRPILGPRDSVRVGWKNILKTIERNPSSYSAEVKGRADALRGGNGPFLKEPVQAVDVKVEYIVSQDANYDIAFSDLPGVMQRTGARIWMGVMVRAKGLTERTVRKEGYLELMGVNYRVDSGADRIDFRHPQCNAFGYSHRLSEYMKYEQHNGYVWDMPDCQYIYSKGPETNNELLFFGIYKVPRLSRLIEPSYADSEVGGMTRIESVWSVGDEVSGVPTSFERISFHVPTLNWEKVMEKRRALDFKGDLGVSINLVRSTDVRLWLNGTPVGARTKVESSLMDAMAVAVETLVANDRISANGVFDESMAQFNSSMKSGGYFYNLLESYMDLKNIAGKVTAPISREWTRMRGALVSAALSPIRHVNVSATREASHKVLPSVVEVQNIRCDVEHFGPNCVCVVLAELRRAMAVGALTDLGVMKLYEQRLMKCMPCVVCGLESMDRVASEGDESTDTSGGSVVDDDVISLVSIQESVESWSSVDEAENYEDKSMLEFIDLERHLVENELSELRIDAVKIWDAGVGMPEADLMAMCTSRTKHNLLEFYNGRCVKSKGPKLDGVGAIYDIAKDLIVPTAASGDLVKANVSDGWYYTCNRLRVWNGPDLVAAVQHARDYGAIALRRSDYKVVVGAPGVGKTYSYMALLAGRSDLLGGELEPGVLLMKAEVEACGKTLVDNPNEVLVLCVTNASVRSAKKYGKNFGIQQRILDARVMTIDKYLMHSKCVANLVIIDEYAMVHAGKVDAVFSLSRARNGIVTGDARQIPYDSFCSDFVMVHHKFFGTISDANIGYVGKTHRLSERMCAIWVDQYPYLYPCTCCVSVDKDRCRIEWSRIKTLDAVPKELGVRYHTYKQEDRDDLRSALGWRESIKDLRARENGGLSTVHEDQGSTQPDLITVRTGDLYDKNASSRVPSLFNRINYVLTDMTRAVKSYRYFTRCDEKDEVIRRIEMQSDVCRIEAVRTRTTIGSVVVADLV